MVVGVSGSRAPGGTDDGLLRPGPVLAGQHAAQGLRWQAGLVPERAQAVAAVGSGLVAAGMHGMLTWVDGGRPGQRSRAVRPGLHGPPGGTVRLAGGGHPGPGGLLR